MRHSTQEERNAYEAMLERKSTVLVASEEFERLKAENERLEELLLDLFCLCFPQNFEWEVTNHAWEKYLPCKRCEEAHGGKSPCASTSKDLAEECCKPFQAVVIADRMRELGVEVR